MSLNTMDAKVLEVNGKRALARFVDFHYDLYRGNASWVPPLRRDELNAFDRSKNPALEFSEVKQWIAISNGKVVGRIAGIIDSRYIDSVKEKAAKFGWIDFVDDPAVASILFSTVEAWAREKGMDKIRGPMQFTDFDATGMLVQGYEELSTFGAGYNYPYYVQLTERNGYAKEVDYIEFQVTMHDEIPEKVERLARLVAERNDLHVLKVKRAKELLPYAPEIFEIINEAYSHLFGFVPLTEHQIRHYIKQYFGFINPELVPVITDASGRIVGFGITIPSLSRAMQKNGGRLFPIGFIPVLRALKNNTYADLYLTAVRPEMQNKGVNAMLIYESNKAFLRNGIKFVETNRELESNAKIQAQWRFYDARQHKKRRVYVKELR